MLLMSYFLLSLFFLIGIVVLTIFVSALRRLPKRESKKLLKNLGPSFFYRKFHLYFFPHNEYESLFFSVLCALNLTRIGYVACATLFFVHAHSLNDAGIETALYDFTILRIILIVIGFLLFSFLLGDYLPRIIGSKYPENSLKVAAPFSSFFLFLVFPITYFFLKLSSSSKTNIFSHSHEHEGEVKQEIIEIIHEAQLSPSLDPHEKKLIESVLTFKERIAREVMVPRVDVFSLPAETTIKEAARLLDEQGYSRIPIYHHTVDNIVGVLMYKDVLKKFLEFEQKGNDAKVLLAPIESIQKNVLYTPETKRISALLQEFRKKQVHLAIVVDEYGGTEGIVTIEDILEEIVGEISDEYDEEQDIYKPQADGSWVIDARMSIIDVDELLNIKIPQDGDYDTIGGYIFHQTGTIPSKGFIIHHDDFELEILESTDRLVEKVRIKPHQKFKHSKEKRDESIN